MGDKFNIDEWKSQAEGRLIDLDSEIASKRNSIEVINEEIGTLEVERVDILKALGRYTEPSTPKRSSGHEGKVMLRPILIEKLMERAGQVVSTDDLVDAVQEEKPTASAESIRMALQRLARGSDTVFVSEDKKGYVYKAPPATEPAKSKKK